MRTETYRELLMKVAEGDGDIFGYANLEGKTSESFREAVEEYRDSIVEKDRIDRFIVPDNRKNIELVDEHFSDPRLRKHFEPRFIPENLVNVNCDFYLWDGKVGIASFEEGELEVRVEDDTTFFEMYKQFFDSLWGLAQRKEVFYGAQTSEMTRLEKKLYLNPDKYLNLAEGYPRDINPDWIEDLRKNPGELKTHDSKELIKKMERYFEEKFNSENVMLCPTATDALVLSADTVIETPGDEVLAFDPGYDAYPNIVRSFGGNLIYVERNQNYGLNLDDLRKKLTPRTEAVAVTNPENPLGLIHGNEIVSELAEICIENDLTLIMDSAHLQATSHGKEVPRLSQFDDLSFLQVGDTGKILGLKGTKIGCLAYSGNLEKELENRANNYFFQLNKYDLKILSDIIFDEKFSEFEKEYLRLLQNNYEYLKENLTDVVQVMKYEGSTVCLVDIEATDMDDKEFCQRMMKEKSIGVVPASYFYGTSNKEEKYVRLALARPRKMVSKTVEAINDIVS